eukprot:1161408-Pelagomonas_calceolata.AAC.4
MSTHEGSAHHQQRTCLRTLAAQRHACAPQATLRRACKRTYKQLGGMCLCTLAAHRHACAPESTLRPKGSSSGYL